VQRAVSLARFSTVRTGGIADYFVRVGSQPELLEVLAWARDAEQPIEVVGSGSNLLIADQGVRGLVIKLDRGLAEIELEGQQRVICGGGARMPALAACAARAGLAGIEFAVNIPGSVGGAVRMNANAYGGELASVLEWVDIATAAGIERRTPPQLAFGYRQSGLISGEIVVGASLKLTPSDPATVKATLSGMRKRRHEAQPQGIKTFGSTFKNPEDPLAEGLTAGQLLAQAKCAGLTIGGARFAPKHANFIENTGDATTADIVAVMNEGRCRVLELRGVELEPEVQTIGPVSYPWL